jgi:CheY-like chemotaxis protein
MHDVSPSSPSQKPRLQDLTVLVVDDEIDIATYLASVLEDAGLNVMVAHDGERALEMIRENPPDLISLDLVMPKKDGIRVLMDLRKNRQWSKIPVVIVTAHAKDAGMRRNLDDVLADSTMTGPSMYLEKPVTPRKYLDGICAALGVSAPPAVSPFGDSHQSLREEAKELLSNVDAATLESVLGQLRKTQDRN